MKWSLQQLHKYNGKPFDFDTVYDFTEDIKTIDDFLDIKETKVRGTGRNIYEDRFEFNIKITTVLILEDAWTLEPIEYPLDIEVVEIFDKVKHEDSRYIEKNTIDLREVVWENIILEKPMRVVKDETETN